MSVPRAELWLEKLEEDMQPIVNGTPIFSLNMNVLMCKREYNKRSLIMDLGETFHHDVRAGMIRSYGTFRFMKCHVLAQH